MEIDIACFLEGERKDKVICSLDASSFFMEIGLSVVVDNCPVIISWYSKQKKMHDLL